MLPYVCDKTRSARRERWKQLTVERVASCTEGTHINTASRGIKSEEADVTDIPRELKLKASEADADQPAGLRYGGFTRPR